MKFSSPNLIIIKLLLKIFLPVLKFDKVRDSLYLLSSLVIDKSPRKLIFKNFSIISTDSKGPKYLSFKKAKRIMNTILIKLNMGGNIFFLQNAVWSDFFSITKINQWEIT